MDIVCVPDQAVREQRVRDDRKPSPVKFVSPQRADESAGAAALCRCAERRDAKLQSHQARLSSELGAKAPGGARTQSVSHSDDAIGSDEAGQRKGSLLMNDLPLPASVTLIFESVAWKRARSDPPPPPPGQFQPPAPTQHLLILPRRPTSSALLRLAFDASSDLAAESSSQAASSRSRSQPAASPRRSVT